MCSIAKFAYQSYVSCLFGLSRGVLRVKKSFQDIIQFSRMVVMVIPYHIKITLFKILKKKQRTIGTEFGIHGKFRQVIEERRKRKPTLSGHEVIQ